MMDNEKLQSILKEHGRWLKNEGGSRANLSGADLSGADLSGAYLSGADLREADLREADLSGADLRWAYLSGADLSGADLRGANLRRAYLRRADLRRADLSGANLYRADLSGADLREAYLSEADLSGANLSEANLSEANLRGTCLDEALRKRQRAFIKQCPPFGRHGGRIVYRAAKSMHVGETTYLPGHTYIAPLLSFDSATMCHPGIYAASREWMEENHPATQLVRCYIRDGDWIISAKGAIRCARLRVLSFVE